jgi:hypothetical protein
LTYPFVIALESLLEWSRETRQNSDKINETVGRLENVFVKFIKEKGTDISYAIMKDIAAKVVLHFAQAQKERVEKREISHTSLRNYIKAIKLFCEMNDIVVPWRKIIVGCQQQGGLHMRERLEFD